MKLINLVATAAVATVMLTVLLLVFLTSAFAISTPVDSTTGTPLPIGIEMDDSGHPLPIGRPEDINLSGTLVECGDGYWSIVPCKERGKHKFEVSSYDKLYTCRNLWVVTNPKYCPEHKNNS